MATITPTETPTHWITTTPPHGTILEEDDPTIAGFHAISNGTSPLESNEGPVENFINGEQLIGLFNELIAPLFDPPPTNPFTIVISYNPEQNVTESEDIARLDANDATAGENLLAMLEMALGSIEEENALDNESPTKRRRYSP